MAEHQDKKLVRQTKETYGDSFTSDLLEQYKLYVQTAESVSSRRVAISRYLLTLSAALIAVYGLQSSSPNQSFWLLFIPLAGIFVSLLWYKMIKSYRNLNRIKFKLIHELEELLPAPLFTREWCIARENGRAYTKVTDIERWIPLLFVALHASLVGLQIWSMIV